MWRVNGEVVRDLGLGFYEDGRCTIGTSAILVESFFLSWGKLNLSDGALGFKLGLG